MKINALMMNEIDNIVTCVKPVKQGELVIYINNNELCQIKAKEDIPFCHKIAIVSLDKDDKVFKYGEIIGRTIEPIHAGCWVSDINIYSIPRDYESEMI